MNNGSLYYDRYGREISITEWGTLLQDRNYKIITYDTLPNGILVSTVWLGRDHGYGGKVLLFETMVFPKDDIEELDVERYATEEGAIAGHKRMVKKWKNRNWREKMKFNINEFGQRCWGMSMALVIIIVPDASKPAWMRALCTLLFVYFFWWGATRFTPGYKKLI